MPLRARDERQRTALRLYAEALAIVDPIRIRVWDEADVTTGQLRLMFFLREYPGATLRELAEFLGVSAPTASGLVERLARHGYVLREEDSHDRRFIQHRLSERGRSLSVEFEREGRALMNQIFGRLPDDQLAQLIASLQALAAAAKDARAEAAHR